MDAEALIQMRQIVKTFKTSAGEVTVLKGIDADFQRGEFVSVVGKSGSGKSTLINMLTGIDHPTSGTVQVAGTFVHTMNESRMSVWRGRNLGIVFQFFQLLPMLTLAENVMLPMDFCDLYTPAERERRAQHLLELVNLGEYADKLPAAISGGQQACCAIARALANDPPILIADEPTGNLDSRTAEQVMRLFEEQVAQGKTFIMVTHDSSLAQRAHRTMLICDGELVNEAVWRAWPGLAHNQMLAISHLGRPLSLAPGEMLFDRGVDSENFYLVRSGQVEVLLNATERVASLGPGQHFGEVELLYGGQTLARVSAAEQPVELLAFDRPAFESLMDVSTQVAEQVGQTAQARRTEHELLCSGVEVMEDWHVAAALV